MRSLWIFGITAAFIVCAFVPPSEANFLALAERARTTIEQRTRGSLLVGNLPNITDLQKAVKLMKNLAKDPKVSVLVEDLSQGANGKVSPDILKKGAAAIESVLPTPKQVVTKVVSKLISTPQLKQSDKWVELLKTEPDQKLLIQLERVDWAAKKGDLRLCKEITVEDSGTGPTTGDLIALCVAKITRLSDRCNQIGDEAAGLKSICIEELASDAEPLSGLKLL